MKMESGRTYGIRLALVTIMVAGMAAAPEAQAEELAKSYSVSGHAKVRVVTDDGSVRVSTGDIKQVEIRVEYRGYVLDKDLHVTTAQNGDTVEIVAKTGNNWSWKWNVRHSELRVEIHMPKDTDLDVTTGDGSVEADSITGNVDIRTGDGHITLQGAKGDIHLRAGDGAIEGRGLDGRLDATTGDGHVNIQGRFDSLNIKTGDGNVTARANGGSKVVNTWNIHTGDGSVNLELPGELQANIDAGTHDGHISLDIPVTVEGTFSSSRINGKMNGGGSPIIVRTGDGSIHLNKS
jgi:Putative adhesin